MTTNRFLRVAAGVGLLLVARAIIRKQRAYDFRDKVVLITGGSRGLGLVLARQLAAEGAKIVICARSADQLSRAEQELSEAGADVFAATCDVTQPSDVNRLVAEVTEHFGRIDVLVNNAGVIQIGALENLSLREFREAMDTNYYGPLHLILAVLPHMRQRREGRIVNISSVGGKVSLPHLLPYSASKFALGGFSKGLRSELMREGITVTTVFPGLVRTGSPRNVIVKGQHRKEYAWFKIADSLPLITASAKDAAAQIIEATRHGEAERVITFNGKLLGVLNELFPAFVTNAFGLVNYLLPKAAPDGVENPRLYGHESESHWSRSSLSASTDRAAKQNNEF